jgi:hypothetical protein
MARGISGQLFRLSKTFEAGRVDLYEPLLSLPVGSRPLSSLVEKLALVDMTPILLDGRGYLLKTVPQRRLSLRCRADPIVPRRTEGCRPERELLALIRPPNVVVAAARSKGTQCCY